MLSYPFLEAVAQTVLLQSRAIQGRVWLAPFFGSELNADNLEQIISDTLSANGRPKQYPLSVIMPPISGEPANGWSSYEVQQLFVTQELRDSGGNTKDLDVLINRSRHTIAQDWHDMRRVAINFLEQLKAFGKSDGSKTFRVSQRATPSIIPVTRVGKDIVNGVLISYTIQLYDVCDKEDYAQDSQTHMIMPSADLHPEHTL